MDIIITKNYKTMSRMAAELIIKQIKKKPASVLGLATGRTHIELYRELVKAHRKKRVRFKKVKTFNLDEYVGLNRSDQRSYHSYMKQRLFRGLDLPKENEYILDGKAENLKKECARFERLIKQAGGIDLQILGIGRNGHIGFNEPGSSFGSKTRPVKLTASTRRANAKYFGGINKMPKAALTMGIGTIMRAKKIILLASGNEKAAIVARALQDKVSRQTPASILQKHPNCVVILDQSAAKMIAKSSRIR